MSGSLAGPEDNVDFFKGTKRNVIYYSSQLGHVISKL